MFKTPVILSCVLLITSSNYNAQSGSGRAVGDFKEKSTSREVVYDRGPSHFDGVILESRYVGQRNDPVRVKFSGTDKVKLNESFSLEAVIHTAEKGQYIWKTKESIYKPINYQEENPILTRGENWGITIKSSQIVFYLATNIRQYQLFFDIPENWHRPVTSHRITATFDNKIMQLYYDREIVGSQRVEGKLIKDDVNIYVGGRADKPKLKSKKIQVDEVRVYNRKLKNDEIKQPLRRSQSGIILSADIIETISIPGN